MNLATFNPIPKIGETLTEARIRGRDLLHRAGDKLRAKQHTLSHTGGNDYFLPANQETVWVQVDEVHIYIRRLESGTVTVETFNEGEHGELIPIGEITSHA
jgi:hypothetical protein